jgi:hypothetical protein
MPSNSSFLIIKKPTFIDFNMELHTETVSLKGRHQILFNGESSNSSLVKLRNGNWYIRYGNVLLELKSSKCKDMTIAKIQNNSGQMLETVGCKWIVQNNKL